MNDDALSLSFSAPMSTAEEDQAPQPQRLYLVGRPQGAAAVWKDHPQMGDAVFVDPSTWSQGSFEHPGIVVFVPQDLSAAELVVGLGLLARGRGEWLPAVGEIVDGTPTLRPLSLGYAHEVSDARERHQDPEGAAPVLELRKVISEISIARHDINNPLTSGLAETQLLLMDITEGEAREGLETIQRQFRRVRDMVKALTPIRLSDV